MTPKVVTRTGNVWRVESSEAAPGFFDVIAPDGSVYGTYSNLQKAAGVCGARQSTEQRKARMVTRPCLCCRQSFESEGAHNRMCDPCRRKESAFDPHRPCLPARRSA